MDPEIEIMLQLTDPIGRDDLQVQLSSSFNRHQPLPQPYQSQMEQVWEARLVDNPKLYNGTKFRLHSIDQDQGKVTFNLGITDYKDFLGTNWAPYADQLLEHGSQLHQDPHAFLSDALGVGNLVITKDDYVIFIRRSQHCGEAQGLIDVPGGHPEPKEIVGKVKSDEIKLEELSKKDVVNEIFNSTLNEVVQEVNIPAEALTDPVLTGVVRTLASAGRPSSEYIVKCSLTSPEVRDLYNKGTQSEAEESTALILLSLSNVLDLQNDVTIWSQLAPSGKGCVLLYQQCVKGNQLK